METQITDAEYIRQELDNGNDVLVQKRSQYQIMIAYAYGQTDTGIFLVTDRDMIRCKWQEENGLKQYDTIPLVELVRAS